MGDFATLAPAIVLDPLLHAWLLEDIGRGDRTTLGLFGNEGVGFSKAEWIAKEEGIVAGLPVAARVFQILDREVILTPKVPEGEKCRKGEAIATIEGATDVLLTGERVALNLVMRLCGVATMTRRYADEISDLSAKLVDTRKTTPGLRILEKYATRVGGAINHRMGLDDAVMIKDNHIQAAQGIENAIARLKDKIPYPLSIEVETSNLAEVEIAIEHGAEIIMLDNMNLEQTKQAVKLIRQANERIKIEASGNITLENIRAVAETGVDYISSSAPVTRSTWLDLSMRFANS